MSTNQLETIMHHVERLSRDDQLWLIKQIADLLMRGNRPDAPRLLQYGEFRGAPEGMSTEEDFRTAEWHPTEKDLNGP